MNWKEWIQDHILTFAALGIVTGVALAAAKIPSIAGVYPVMVGAILALCGIHKADETTYDYLQNKIAAVQSQTQDQQDSSK